jgi:LysM repeat protein
MRQSISPTGEMIVDFGEPSSTPVRSSHHRVSHKVLRWVSVIAASVSLIAVCCVQPLVHAQTLHTHSVETYVVQPGESLWGYAQRFTPRGGDVYRTLDSLMALNHLSNGQIQAGQVLKVAVQH